MGSRKTKVRRHIKCGVWSAERKNRIQKSGVRIQKKKQVKRKGGGLRGYRMYRATLNTAFALRAVFFANCHLVINKFQCPCAACINAATAAEAEVSIYGDRHQYPSLSPAKRYPAGSFRGFS